MRHICQICGYIYDDEIEGIPFEDLPDSWTCPMCKAPKSMFEKEEDGKEDIQHEPIEMDESLEELSPGVLAAIFSNLARGAEKQYKAEEERLFRKLSDYFAESAPAPSEADLSVLSKLVDDAVSKGYPRGKDTASRAKDRGALRACTWGEKVERIVHALLERYEKEGESFLESERIWVCSVCGFIYIGNDPPAICPVCKVPDWKFEMIE